MLSQKSKRSLLLVGIFLFWFPLFSASFAEAEQKAGELEEIQVQEDLPVTASSSRTLRKKDLELRPIRRVGDLLEVTPGLTTIQHAGGGKANQYYLRGFDADHGTDIAFFVDQVPVNMVSHAHGQGYADFNFVIPELVDQVEVRKGPYFAQDGDLATAGAVNLVLKKRLKGNLLSFQAGRFQTYRGLAVAGRSDEKKGFYIANEVYTTDGPFQNPENFFRYNFFARGFIDSEKWQAIFTGSSYKGVWNASGQIPLSLVQSGELSRLGTLDPSDGGESQRHQIYAQLNYKPDAKQNLNLLFYGAYYDLDLFSNFTFFLNDPVNGDQIQQSDRRLLAGYQAVYSRNNDWGKVGFKTTLGQGLRFDRIHNALNHTTQRVLIEKNAENELFNLNPSFYVQEEIFPASWIRLVLGMRTDLLYFNSKDNLGKEVEGSKTAWVFSPKASVIFTPKKEVELFLNFGRGFHSNDARGVLRSKDPANPYAQATGGEIGIRTKLFDKLDLALAGWAIHLGSELVYVGDEGTTEAKGPTLRIGGEAEIRYSILQWLTADIDFTYSRGHFTNLPSGENAIPLAPRWTLSGGLTASRETGFYGAIRVRGISDRPANEDRSLTATGYVLVDLRAGYRFKKFQWTPNRPGGLNFQLDVLNLLNANYRESQFDTTSRPYREGPEIRDIHFTPGYPVTVMGSVALEF